MPLITPRASSAKLDVELLPEGNYPARCYSVVHQGTSVGMYGPQTQAIFRFELPNELAQFYADKDEQPHAVSVYANVSDSTGSQFYKMMQALGVVQESGEFDPEHCVGRTCMLNVTHRKGKNGITYLEAKPLDVKPTPKGLTIPDQINESQFLWLTAKYVGEWVATDDPNKDEYRLFYCENAEMFGDLDALFDWQKDKIVQSWEYNNIQTGKPYPAEGVKKYNDFHIAPVTEKQPDDDDLPF